MDRERRAIAAFWSLHSKLQQVVDCVTCCQLEPNKGRNSDGKVGGKMEKKVERGKKKGDKQLKEGGESSRMQW